MTTEEERQAHADAIEARLAADNGPDVFLQAIGDGLTDMASPVALRLRSFIRQVALDSNPDPVMRQYARTWLDATEGLVTRGKDLLAKAQAAATNEADET